MEAVAEGARSRWKRRPGHALAVRVVAFLLPFAVSTAVVFVVAQRLDRPEGIVAGIGWWVGLSALATAVLLVVDRLAKRLLPLSAMLGLSLAFPDHAPSRFKIAIRTGTVRQLEEKIAAARRGELGDTPQEAAESLLELVAALNRHDRLTRGHAERVRAYARMIGEQMGLDEADVERLQWSALLHDIGKLAVPYEILNKTGSLTDDEWETVRLHPEVGDAMVEPLREWLGEWADAVGQHHERWDGQGYPQGLSGTDISFAARVVSVADVFDVITAARSYKKPLSADEARKELSRCAGSQFDPAVVRAFLDLSLGRMPLSTGMLSWLPHSGVFGHAPGVPAAFASYAVNATAAATIGLAGLAAGSTTGPVGDDGPAHSADPAEEAAGEVEVTSPRPVSTLPESSAIAVPLPGELAGLLTPALPAPPPPPPPAPEVLPVPTPASPIDDGGDRDTGGGEPDDGEPGEGPEPVDPPDVIDEGVDETVDDVLGGVDETVDDVLGGVDETVDDVLGGVDETVDDVLDGVDETVDDVLDGVDETVDDVLDGVGDLLGGSAPDGPADPTEEDDGVLGGLFG